ncbi:MAG: DUF721 domain-containing protein [Nitrospirales bacterium]
MPLDPHRFPAYHAAMPSRAPFTSVGSVLNTVARRFGLESKLLEHHLQTHWPEVAGERVAAHTRPDSIRFKKLYLIAENSVWLHQLTFLKPMLLNKINAAAGREVVTEVVLRVGEVQGREPRAERKAEEAQAGIPRQPDPALLAEASQGTAAVRDPELRAHLTTVMARALTPTRHREPDSPVPEPPAPPRSVP